MAVGSDKSAFKKALTSLDNDLREKGVLPPLATSTKIKDDKPKVLDSGANTRATESKRIAQLEAENFELKVQVKELQASLTR
jgi:hypothetical protein